MGDLLQQWLRLEQRYVPAGLSGLDERRARLIVRGALSCGALLVLWTPLELWLVGAATASFVLLSGLSLLVVPALLARSGSLRLASHTLLSLCFTSVGIVTITSGGPGSENLVAMLGIPVVAGMLTTGWRACALWTGIALAFVGGYTAAHAAGLTRAPLLDAGEREVVLHTSMLVILAAIGIISILFDRLRSQALQDVEALNVRLEAERDRAEHASAAKSTFLAAMSHELRTPMNGIMGGAEVLSGTPLSAEQQRYVQIIQASSSVMLQQLTDLLDLSSAEAGALALSPAPTSLSELCRAAVLSQQGAASSAGLVLRLEVEEPDGDLLIDPARLRQVLLSLVSNAIKFTPAGEIVVRARVEQGELQLAVSDTGIGIAEAHHATIFDRFAQVEQGSQRTFTGAGLGLSICQEIATRMGGEMSLESRLGEGSTFTLRCPAALASGRSPPLEAAMSVLLVEDNPINQALTAAMLRGMGCAVTIAAQGQVAVERAAAEPFALILMDCMMPVMDGCEAARQIRRAGINQDTPILALTANGLPEDRLRTRASGMDEHLTKPISRAALQRALVRWQDQQHEADAKTA